MIAKFSRDITYTLSYILKPIPRYNEEIEEKQQHRIQMPVNWKTLASLNNLLL